jgi:hypothetical protein
MAMEGYNGKPFCFRADNAGKTAGNTNDGRKIERLDALEIRDITALQV